MIDKNQIKKVLYKEKPLATKVHSRDNDNDEVYFYKTTSSLGQHYFVIPVKEMGVLPLAQLKTFI